MRNGNHPSDAGRVLCSEVEATVLRAVCMGTAQGSVKETAKSLLADYRWRSSLHEALWKALSKSLTEDAQKLKEWLPAELTRLGFPDAAWEDFFIPVAISRQEAISLIRHMAIGGGAD